MLSTEQIIFPYKHAIVRYSWLNIKCNDWSKDNLFFMLMTMGVLNKHDYKHEFITLRQRTFYGIIESMEDMKFLNNK